MKKFFKAILNIIKRDKDLDEIDGVAQKKIGKEDGINPPEKEKK